MNLGSTLLPYSPNRLNHKFICIMFKDSDPTTRKTHCVSVTKISWLKLFREKVAVCCENRTKPINTLWSKKTRFLIFKASGTHIYRGVGKGCDPLYYHSPTYTCLSFTRIVQNFVRISHVACACRYLFHSHPWFDHPNNIWWRLQITELLLLQLRPSSSQFASGVCVRARLP
jgi:hypothetical protein